MDPSTMYLTAFIIIGGIIFLVLFFHYVPFFLWLSAKVSGVNISLVQLFLMRIRNVPPYIIVPGLIEAHKAGLSNITRDELEAHYLAGGHVEKVVHALVSASKANIELPFQMATAIDLAGRDVFEAVQMSVNPKVIAIPQEMMPQIETSLHSCNTFLYVSVLPRLRCLLIRPVMHPKDFLHRKAQN